MTDNKVLRELLTPMCPLGTEHTLILQWVQKGTLFRVKQVPGYYLDVWPALVNHRLTATWIDNQEEYDRFWCYAGRGQSAFLAAVLAAAMWDGSDDTEPLGWNKNGQTKEWREVGHSQVWQTSRAVEVATGIMDAEGGWPEK